MKYLLMFKILIVAKSVINLKSTLILLKILSYPKHIMKYSQL